MRLLINLLAVSTVLASLAGCSWVDVTKTGRGYHAPADANRLDILMTVPQRRYKELGTVTALNFHVKEEAKMHNALRSKAARLGADAVIIQQQGISLRFLAPNKRWAMGVAVRYQ